MDCIMSHATFVSIFRVEPRDSDAVVERLTPLIWLARKESGRLFFDLYRLVEQETTFAIHQIWDGHDARRRHLEGLLGTQIHNLMLDVVLEPVQTFEIEEVL
jgi:quinol monooxygenase YgiN